MRHSILIATSILLLNILTACSPSGGSTAAVQSPTNTAQGAGAIELPDLAIGVFTGTLILNAEVRQQITATVSKSSKNVTISFSQGIPPFQALVPSLQNYMFEVTPGSQIGVYQSMSEAPSQAGVSISTGIKPNLNIVDVTVGATKVNFTGTK